MPADLDRVTRNVEIVDAILSGETPQEVGPKYGITDRQVYRILNDENYRAILEQGQREQLTMLPKANRKLNALIDSEDEGIAFKAVAQIQKNTGITPTRTSSVYINNLVQGAQITATAAPVMDMLRQALEYQRQGEVVDVTPGGEDD